MKPLDWLAGRMPFVTTPGFNPAASSPTYSPPAFGGYPGAYSAPPTGGGVTGAATGGGLMGYDDPRQRGVMATAAALLAASRPSRTRPSAGANIGNAMLAGMTARDNQIAAIQQAQQAQQTMIKQQEEIRRARDEEARANALREQLSGMQFPSEGTPQERAGKMHAMSAQLWAAGDYDGAISMMQKADEIWTARGEEEYQDKRREQNARIMSYNKPSYQYGTNEAGEQYMVADGSTQVRYLTDADGNRIKALPKAGGGDVKVDPAEVANVQTTLQGINDVYMWLGNRGDRLFNSVFTQAWDRSAGRMMGTSDFSMTRNLDFITSGALLDKAASMKGALSDKDVLFLQQSLPKPGDSVETKQRWLADLHRRMTANLAAAGYEAPQLNTNTVASKYGLEMGVRKPEGEW